MSLTFTSFGQYPFERFPAIKYNECPDWKEIDNRKNADKAEHCLTVPKFFNKKDSLSIKLTTLTASWDTTYIAIYRNGKISQTFIEPLGYNPIEPLRLADFNGDGLTDLKLIFPYMGNGTASLNTRVVYLLQQKDNRFTKVSYFDKMGSNSVERDFNGDGNYEIITMTLMSY